MLTPLPMVCLPPYPWYIERSLMVSWTAYPWNIEPPIHGILNPYPWYIEPYAHAILTPLPMVYRTSYTWYIECSLMVSWTSYPWYIEPPIHGILNPLSMVYGNSYPLHFDPSPNNGISNPLPMVYRTPSFGRNEGVQFTIMWFKIQDRFFRGSKYHMTPFIVRFVLLNQVFCAMLYKSCLVILSFFVFPLYCFSFLDLRFFYLQTFLHYIIYARVRWAMQRLLFI